jgi:hypothetical protein
MRNDHMTSVTSNTTEQASVSLYSADKVMPMSAEFLNPFQSNFSATHILPSSFLFWAGKRLVDYL